MASIEQYNLPNCEDVASDSMPDSFYNDVNAFLCLDGPHVPKPADSHVKKSTFDPISLLLPNSSRVPSASAAVLSKSTSNRKMQSTQLPQRQVKSDQKTRKRNGKNVKLCKIKREPAKIVACDNKPEFVLSFGPYSSNSVKTLRSAADAPVISLSEQNSSLSGRLCLKNLEEGLEARKLRQMLEDSRKSQENSEAFINAALSRLQF